MKKLLLATLALSFALVTACSSTPSPLVKPDFALTPRLKLDVATVSVVDRSGVPTADSTPEAKEFKAMVMASIRKWAGANIVPVGTFGEAIVVIRDASLKAQALPHDDDWFTREQATKYIGHIELEVNVSGVDNLREQASAQAVRYETLPDAPTVDERLGVYYRIIEGLNQDLDANLGAAMREHLASFVLPGSAQIAEGSGKQNVMQAYPTGGQPCPVPGVPYQKVKASGAVKAPQLTVTPPSADQMAVQYESTYIPIPPEEMESSAKAGIKSSNDKIAGKMANMSAPPSLVGRRAEKDAYVGSSAQVKTLGTLPKAVGSSVVMGQPDSMSAPGSREGASAVASAVGGYGALPVYQPGEAPTSLKVPSGASVMPVSLSSDNESMGGNISTLPAPVVIQANQPKPASPMDSTSQPAALKAKVISEQRPAMENKAVAEAPTPSAALPAANNAQNASPASDARARTVMGAGGRIRTITISEPSSPMPERSVPGVEAQASSQPDEADEDDESASSPAQAAAPAKSAPVSDAAAYLPPPQQQPQPVPAQAQAAPIAPPTPVAPRQQVIAFPVAPAASPSSTAAAMPQKHGEPLYPNARYTSDLPAPAVQAAQPAMTQPVPPSQTAAAPAVAAGMSAPRLPEASPLLTSQTMLQPAAASQGAPCPAPSSGSAAAYGTNCSAALSSPSAYPTSPYTVE